MNILVYCSNETAKQNQLERYYNATPQVDEGGNLLEPDPKTLVSFNEETGEYDFIVDAAYPHIYKRNGLQSVICYKCSQQVKDLIDNLPSAVEVLAIDDNNPDTDYQWEKTNSESKFLSVVGNNFFTGDTYTDENGNEFEIPPRKKLACLV